MPILNVPLSPQWGVGANRFRNDCGPACVAMLLKYYGKLNGLTIDALANETGLRQSDTGLLPVHLVSLALRHNLRTTIRVGTSLADLRGEIDAGRPVIVLVAFRFILGRLDQADNVPGRDGHYLIVTGYDDSHFVLNDPDVWQPYLERGHDCPVPVTELQQAMAEYQGQCVVMELPMSIADQITALATQIDGLTDQIETLAAQIPPELPPPDVPTKIVVTTTKLNVRLTPDTTLPAVAVLAGNTQVKVVDAPGAWLQIAAGETYAGKWISAAYTRPM